MRASGEAGERLTAPGAGAPGAPGASGAPHAAAPGAPGIPRAAAPGGLLDRNALVDSFGLACYIAWSYVFWDSPLLLEGTAGPGGYPAGPLLLAQGIFTGVAALVLMLAWGRIAPLRRNLPVIGLFTLMEVASVVLAALGQAGFAATLAVVGFALSGAGSAMRLGWEERMSVRGVGATALRAALGYVFGALLYAVLMMVPASAAVAAMAALPLVSLALLIVQERRHPDDGVVTPDPAVAPVGVRVSFRACFERVPWRIPAFVVLSYFCYGATRMNSLSGSLAGSSLPGSPGALVVIVAMLACCTGAVLAYAAYRRSVQAGICIAVPILAAAGLCNVIGVPNAEVAVLFVANVGVEITKYLMLFLMIDVIIKDGAPALLCLALLRFAQWGGSALGQGVADALPVGVSVAVAMLLVLMAALLLVMGAFPAGMRMGSGNAGEAAASAADDDRASQAASGARAQQIATAAQRFGLSPRETEVLGIWATGRSAAYVEKALFISQSTVKTHLNHIYAKTGTANRGELLELLDAIE